LSFLQVRKGRDCRFSIQDGPDGLNLRIGHGNRTLFVSQDSHYPGGFQDFQPVEGVEDFVDEKVTGKEGFLDFLPAILAAAPDLEFGEESMHPFVLQPQEHYFFVPAPGMNAVPE
jgi:hypothetical protein